MPYKFLPLTFKWSGAVGPVNMRECVCLTTGAGGAVVWLGRASLRVQALAT